MKLKYKAKYSVGDFVTIDRIFTVERHGSYDYSEGTIITKIVRVDATSIGYCYELKSIDNIYLGGVMYWERDITGIVATQTDLEENMWMSWGDQ